MGGFAGFDRDRVRGERAGRQGGGDAGDDMIVGHAAVQQQYLDQGSGALGVAAGLAHRRPPGVMHRGELAGGTGLLQHGRSGQRTRLAHQCFQVVVEFQLLSAAADDPVMAGYFPAAVEDHQFGSVQ